MTTVSADITGHPVTKAPVAETPVGSMGGVVIADPAPLGLAAFGLTTLVLSAINAGWVGDAATPAVLALAIPFGGAAQIFAGMWAFRRGSTFAATAFTSFGAFWISYYLLVNFFIAPVLNNPAGGLGEAHTIVGLYLFSWGVFTTYMFVASLGSARAVQLVFFLLAATFFLLCIGEWASPADKPYSDFWHHFGGWAGMATAAAALYVSFADVTNANLKKTVLPT